MAYKQQQSLFL